MEQMVPICPSRLATFLSLRGFPGNQAVLDATEKWLRGLDIICEADFIGLSPLSTAQGADDRPKEVIVFLDSLAKVSIFCVLYAWLVFHCLLVQDTKSRPQVLNMDLEIIEDDGPSQKRARCDVICDFGGHIAPEPVVCTPIISEALALADAPPLLLDVTGKGPNDAIRLLKESLPCDMRERILWQRRARVAAVLGSCPKTRSSFRSGIRNWVNFIGALHRSYECAFPARLDDVLSWSHVFRCVGTWSNYMGYLRTASVALDLPCPAADHPALKHAKIGVLKRMLHTPRCAGHGFVFAQRQLISPSMFRPKLFLQRSVVLNIVLAADRGIGSVEQAMLWLLAYQFLLRVPSEALPLCRGAVDYCPSQPPPQAMAYLDGEGMLCIRLRTRKNRQEGSLLRRSCSCSAHPRTCMVHVFWHKFLSHFALGEKPWGHLSGNTARCLLRDTLRALEVRTVLSHLCCHFF